MKKEKRKLGDQWLSWKGELGDDIANSNAGKRIFLGILLILYVCFGCAVLFAWFMMTPRLNLIHPQLGVFTGMTFGTLWLLLGFWIALLTLSIVYKKHIFLKLRNTEFCITRLAPIVQRWGMRFGISPDRIGNSFIKVSNTLMKIMAHRVAPQKLMILLPRCLQKGQKDHILEFSKEKNIPVFTVPGGEMARDLMHKHQPEAVIGIACERDLMSGICDACTKTQVIGIPNCRPEGPCKNTQIDLLQLEDAIDTFLEVVER